MSGTSVVTTKSACRIFSFSACAIRPVSMSSPGVQSEWWSKISRSDSVLPMKHAPEVSHGRKCRESMAIRYSSACSLAAVDCAFSASTFTEHRSASLATTAPTIRSSPGPMCVSASSRSA